MIETQRLILRKPAFDDFTAIRDIYADPDVVRHIGDGKPATPQDSWFRLLRFAGHWQIRGFGYFAVTEKETGAYVGNVGLAGFMRGLGDDFDPYPETGWVLAASAHGKGYATEAAQAAHDWFDREHGRQRTVCIIDPPNKGSIRVAEKLGYRLIGERPFRTSSVLMFERVPG